MSLTEAGNDEELVVVGQQSRYRPSSSPKRTDERPDEGTYKNTGDATFLHVYLTRVVHATMLQRPKESVYG